MATVTLGKAPKNFKKLVTFKMLDGTDGSIECLFKYRTVTAYGALKDEMSKDAGALDPSDPAFWERFMEKRRDKGGEFLSQMLEGWNLDADFSQASLQQLADELPGAVAAIVQAYDAAIAEGRLGN
jgi:hypothetical protein